MSAANELRHHRRDYMTHVTSVAPDFSTMPSTWLRFLNDVFEGDSEVVDFIGRLLGYCVTGETRVQIAAA